MWWIKTSRFIWINQLNIKILVGTQLNVKLLITGNRIINYPDFLFKVRHNVNIIIQIKKRRFVLHFKLCYRSLQITKISRNKYVSTMFFMFFVWCVVSFAVTSKEKSGQSLFNKVLLLNKSKYWFYINQILLSNMSLT
jgi:hypothetical protein